MLNSVSRAHALYDNRSGFLESINSVYFFFLLNTNSYIQHTNLSVICICFGEALSEVLNRSFSIFFS